MIATVRKLAPKGLLALLTAVTLLWAVSSFSAAASSAHKTKKPSLSSVTIVDGFPSNGYPAAIAQAKGFFAQNGLAVTIEPVTSSASAIFAVLVAGSAQFAHISASATALGISSGGPVRAVMSANYSVYQELVINQSFASGHNIPASASNESQAEAQIEALKGSHMRIATINTTGDGYNYLIYELSRFGIHNGPGGDVTVSTVGSQAATVAALNSGQADAFMGSPPTTVVPNTDDIQLDLLPVANVANSQVIATGTTLIRQDPDTVQAFVTSLVEAWNYALKNPNGAIRALTSAFSAAGIASPEEVDYLATSATEKVHVGATPALTKVGFNAMLLATNTAHPTAPITFGFSDWADNKFVDNSIHQLGLKLLLG